MGKFSRDKAYKFRKEDRFFDINYVWSPGYIKVVERLFYTSIRPEFVVFLSLIAGILSSYLYGIGGYYLSLLAGFLIWLKNYLDTVDGHLARAKDMASRLGRFLDSLSDAVVYLCLFTGIAYNLSNGANGPGVFIIAYLAMLSAFIQCSFYNYYVVSYKNYVYEGGLNRTDESISDDDRDKFKGLNGGYLYILQLIYLAVYGWQDKIVTAVDKYYYSKYIRRHKNLNEGKLEKLWYTSKRLVALSGPLSFGTQILALAIFTILNKLEVFLWFLIIVGNTYTFLFISGRFLLINRLSASD